MRNFLVFTKKEITEQIRSYKAFILLAVLLLFGIMSPLLAKMMPDILSGMAVEGIKLTLPEPTVYDAWAQFFKNTGQMGLIALLLIFGGMLSQEMTKETIILPLSKGLPRDTVIISKYFTALLSWSVSYVLSVLAACWYTYYLFGQFTAENLYFSLFCMWLFGAFLLAVILFSSAVSSGSYGGLILTAVITGILLMINISPKAAKYNPVSLASANSALLTGTKTVDDLLPSVFITVGSIVLSLALSLVFFRKKRL